MIEGEWVRQIEKHMGAANGKVLSCVLWPKENKTSATDTGDSSFGNLSVFDIGLGLWLKSPSLRSLPTRG